MRVGRAIRLRPPSVEEVMTHLTRILLSMTALGLVFGCTSGPPSTGSDVETAPQYKVKIPVEAYLFDVAIKRHGKATSLRLDVFDADSVIALGGRAYLGKGALRARLTKDSLIAFFPTSNEFLREDFSSFSISGENRSDFSKLGLLKLLKQPPDTGTMNDSMRVEFTQVSSSDTRWTVHSTTYDSAALPRWRLELTYALTDGYARLRYFSYTDINMTITANRREYRTRARVPADRFRVTIPPSAVRVSP